MAFWKRVKQFVYSLQEGPAHRVIFYYQGEDPTYLDEAFVTVYRNGVVEVVHRNEHVSTHVQNVEILWKSRNSQTSGGQSARMLSLVRSSPSNSSPSK